MTDAFENLFAKDGGADRQRSPDISGLIASLPDTPDRSIRARFCTLAVEHQFVSASEPVKGLNEILTLYQSYPAFFADMVEIFENNRTSQGMCSDFYFAIVLSESPSDVVMLLGLTKSDKPQRLFDAIWRQWRNDSSSGYPRLRFDPARWLEKKKPVIQAVTAVNELDYYNPYAYPLYELAYKHSNELAHDLSIIAKDSKPRNFNAETLRSYYESGFKYICHEQYFGEYEYDFQRERARPKEEIATLALFASLEQYPDLKEQERFVPSLSRLNPHLRSLCVRLVGRAVKDAIHVRPLTSLIECLEALSETDIPLAVNILKRIDAPANSGWQRDITLLEDIVRTHAVTLTTAANAFEDGRVVELEREIYSAKLAEHQRKFPEKPLDEVFKAFSIASQPDSETVPEEKLIEVFAEYQRIVRRGQDLLTITRPTLEVLGHQVRENLTRETISGGVTPATRIEFYAIARELFKSHFGVYPYNTQLIAALLLDKVDQRNSSRGSYEEVKTGEGKSLMFALISGYKACCGRRVDIVTSNSALAERDEERFSAFFASFGLSTGSLVVNAKPKDNSPKSDKPADIIYSTNQDMIFTYLAARLDGSHFLGGDRFDTLLIDEADNLCLDLTTENCRLGGEAPAIHGEEFYRAVMAFVDTEFSQGVIRDLTTAVAEFKVRHNEYREMNPTILALYLNSAIHSREVKENVNFIINDQQIVVVDHQNTERVKERTHWSNGLHEFTALRHGLELPAHSTLIAQMSHPSFIKKYREIICISGTFGDSVDRAEMKKVYDISGFDVPTHHPSKRIDLPLTLYLTHEEQLQNIRDTAQNLTRRDNPQPLLIVCQSIRESRMLSKYLGDLGFAHQLLNDVDNCDESGASCSERKIVERAGIAGVITVATSVAGRGVDIIPSKESIEAGGLYSYLTFVPLNLRVEFQSRGRAGRQGMPGTSGGGVDLSNDSFITSLSATEQSLLLGVFREYGGNSPQTQKTLNFIRRANNLLNSALRVQRMQIDEILEEMFDKYVNHISEASEQLSRANPICASSEGLGRFLVHSYLNDEWVRQFGEVDSAVRYYDILDKAQRKESWRGDEISPRLSDLQQVFIKVYGHPPEDLTGHDSIFESSALGLNKLYQRNLAWVEARFSRFSRDEAVKIIQQLEKRIDDLTEECVGKFRRASSLQIRSYIDSINKARNDKSKQSGDTTSGDNQAAS